MQKKSLLALLLALMLLLSGCELVTVNTEKDNAQVIVDVNGETVSKAALQLLLLFLIYYACLDIAEVRCYSGGIRGPADLYFLANRTQNVRRAGRGRRRDRTCTGIGFRDSRIRSGLCA